MNDYKKEIEKIAKQMPYKTPGGNWAIPRGWEEAYTDDDDKEGTWENDYYRKEYKIPSHYKRIADDGMGNSTFVDTMSDESNPDFYDWDHETTQLSKWNDKDKVRNYSLSDNEKGRELANIMKYKDLKNISKDKLKELGYYKDPTMKEKIMTPLKGIEHYAVPGAVLGGLIGLSAGSDAVAADVSGALTKAFKKGAIGAGIGTALTTGLGAKFLGVDTVKGQDIEAAKRKIMSDYYDGEDDNIFMNQYKKQIEKKASYDTKHKRQYW